ncbi:MAG: peptidase M17, partial [Desulfobacterales bacterium]|nr:peptidase M17 [Desulfobacterales bacterium]
SWGIETYKPTCIIDAATLTGAVIIGLGHHYTGLISNNDELTEQMIEAGRISGEPVWRLPLDKNFKKQIESKVADIKNTGGRPGGSITAGAYLSNFVDETPWVHLDIAGTAWDFTDKPYIPKGPSGTATRTFINLIRNWKFGKVRPAKQTKN